MHGVVRLTPATATTERLLVMRRRGSWELAHHAAVFDSRRGLQLIMHLRCQQHCILVDITAQRHHSCGVRIYRVQGGRGRLEFHLHLVRVMPVLAAARLVPVLVGIRGQPYLCGGGDRN